MKKFVILLSFIGFFSLNLSAQNIYIRGHIEVTYIGPGGIDVICHPPYDTDCLSIISEAAFMQCRDVNDESVNKVQPKVQVVGKAMNCDGLPTNVYRIRKDAIKEVVKD